MNPKSNPRLTEIVTLQNTIDNLTNQIHDLTDKLDNLRVDYDYVKNTSIKSNNEISAVKTQLEAKTTALFASLAKLDAANASVAKLNSIVQHEEWKQNRALEAAEKEQKRIQDNCNHLNEIVKTQSETIKAAQKKIDELKISENHLAQKLVTLHNDYTGVCKELETLKNSSPVSPNEELTKLREENAQLKKDIFKIQMDNSIQDANYIKYKTFVSAIKTRCIAIQEANLVNKPKLTLELLSFIFTTIANSFSK